LKFASFKISELEKLAREHEWKSKYAEYHTAYSLLAFIFTSVVIIYVLYKLVRFVFPYCKTNTALKAIAASTTEHLGSTTES
jgi:adenosylmethionine-8-amino-7-oxononanoate aminotransferase